MMDYKLLIERLEDSAVYVRGKYRDTAVEDAMFGASVAIENLLAERDEALRAQQSPAKLDRSRWKGCEHCTTGRDYNDYKKWTEGELGEIRISKDELNIDVGPYWETVKIKFCPFCGRPLTEEAWAELERRIGGNDGKTDIF